MPERILEVTPLTPLHFGDGRPFVASRGDETHARSLLMPLPGSFAGFVRTQYALGEGINLKDREALRQIHGLPVYGPVLFFNGYPRLPAPLDAICVDRDRGQVSRLKPVKQILGGTDLPEGMHPLKPEKATKAEAGLALWSRWQMEQWLMCEEHVRPQNGEPPEDVRIHIKIDPARHAAEEGMLFSVAYRSLGTQIEQGGNVSSWTLRGRVKLPDGANVEEIGFLGGERRPVHLRLLDGLVDHWWDVPDKIKQIFKERSFNHGKALIRMVLVTPAFFSGGWIPGWVGRSGAGEKHLPRGLAKVKLRLVAAAVGRKQPVSGWSVRENRPKAVRWAVPAGSVYFFEVEDGDPAAVLESWMRPVSDLEQDRKDGFGLVVWGVGGYADES